MCRRRDARRSSIPGERSTASPRSRDARQKQTRRTFTFYVAVADPRSNRTQIKSPFAPVHDDALVSKEERPAVAPEEIASDVHLYRESRADARGRRDPLVIAGSSATE